MRKKLLSILVLSILAGLPLFGCAPSTLTILSMTEGSVSVMKAGTDDWIKGEVGMSLEEGDFVKTSDDSSAEITFFDGSTIELEAGTEIEVASLDIARDTGSVTIILEQTIGSIIFRVTKIIDPASRYEVETPTGAVVVRGSAMQVYVIEDGTTWVTNLEGDIWVVAQGVELQVPEGRQCIIRSGEPPELIKLLMVAAGYWHTVGLKSDGTVIAVGNNVYGQCNVGNWTDIIQVTAGWRHTVGLRSDGTVVTVGDNRYGECNTAGWANIIQVSADAYYTLGVRSDGVVVALGPQGDYELDYPEGAYIPGFGQLNVAGWTNIVQVSAGTHHTVGLKSDGTAVAVGWNDHGQCDVSEWTGIVQVTTGGSGSCTFGLKSDGTVVAVGSSSSWCNVGSWTDIIQITAGAVHTVGLKSDGTAVAVGDNAYGKCDVGGWTDIVQVTAGAVHTVGLKSDGTAVAVGSNYDGQCDVSNWGLN